MDRLLSALLAAIIAYVSIGFTVINSKYTNTYFLISRCYWLYMYPAIFSVYAIVCFVALSFMPLGFLREHIGVGGHIWDNTFVQATFIGLFITQVLHWNFFKVSTEGQITDANAFDFGGLFRAAEKFVIRKIALSHHYALEKYLEPFISHNQDLEEVRTKAKRSIPTALKRSEKLDIKEDIEKAVDVHEIMEIYEIGRAHV